MNGEEAREGDKERSEKKKNARTEKRKKIIAMQLQLLRRIQLIQVNEKDRRK